MGQKSNPIALRTRQKGRFFDSSWYNDIDYGKAISRDQMIEKYLGSLTKNMRNQNSRFYIQELSKKYILTLFYFKAQETRKKRSKPLSLRKRRSKKNHPTIGYYINTMGMAVTNRRKSSGVLAKKNRAICDKLKIWSACSNKLSSTNQRFGLLRCQIKDLLAAGGYFYRSNRNKYSFYLRQKKTEKLNIAKIPERVFSFTRILQNLHPFWSRKSLFHIYENKSLLGTDTVIGGSSLKQSLKNNPNIASQRSIRNQRFINGKGISLLALQSCFIKKYKHHFKNQSKKYNNQSIVNNYYSDGLKQPFTNLLTTINTQSHILVVKKPTLKQRYQQLQSFGVFQTILSSGNKGYYHQMIKNPSYLYINKMGSYLRNKKVYEITKDASKTEKKDLPGIKYLPALGHTSDLSGGEHFTPYSTEQVAGRNGGSFRTKGSLFFNKKGVLQIRYPFLTHDDILQKGRSPINKILYTHYLYNQYAKLYTNYKLYRGYKYKKFDIGTKKKRGLPGMKYLNNQKFANHRKRMRKMFAKTYFKDLVKKKYKQHISNMLSHIVKSNVILRVRHLKSEYLSANSLAEEIAYYMKRGSRFGQIKNRIIQELDQGLISPKIIGMRISCSGRIGGRSKKALRSRTLGLRNGSVTLNNFTSKIDYCCKKARTRYGIVGIKVWLSYR